MEMELTAKNNMVDYDELKENEYATFSRFNGEDGGGLVWLCRGCGKPVHISTEKDYYGQSWTIDFITLTATPSIKHDKAKSGCGWHGHLENGKFKEG